MRNKRHDAILSLIKENSIETQQDLTVALASVGFDVTQATVSRDIKELRLLKRLNDDGRYVYAYNADTESSGISDKMSIILSKSIVKIDRPLQFDICITGTCNFLNAIVVEHADDTGKDAFLYIRSHSFCGKMGARIFNIFGRSAPNNIFRSCTPCNICGSSDSDCTVRSCNINNNIFGSCTPDK